MAWAEGSDCESLVWFEICHCILVDCFRVPDSSCPYSFASNNDGNVDGGLLSEALQGGCELLTIHGSSRVGRLHHIVRYGSSVSQLFSAYVGLVVHGRHLEGRNGASALDAIGKRWRLGSLEVAMEGESGGHDDNDWQMTDTTEGERDRRQTLTMSRQLHLFIWLLSHHR